MIQAKQRIATNDRQLVAKERETELFFFPKNNPPISVRAVSREEAERILQEPNNHKEV